MKAADEAAQYPVVAAPQTLEEAAANMDRALDLIDELFVINATLRAERDVLIAALGRPVVPPIQETKPRRTKGPKPCANCLGIFTARKCDVVLCDPCRAKRIQERINKYKRDQRAQRRQGRI